MPLRWLACQGEGMLAVAFVGLRSAASLGSGFAFGFFRRECIFKHCVDAVDPYGSPMEMFAACLFMAYSSFTLMRLVY